MKCQACGGALEWVGPLSALTHLRCLGCGAEPAEREVECSACNPESEHVLENLCDAHMAEFDAWCEAKNT